MTADVTASVTDPAPAQRTPGRPRSSHADASIIDAVLGLLSEGTTVEALSMEAVAARAGVGKATIYRRFADKDEMVLAAVKAIKGPPPEPVGESVREDLLALIRHARKRRGGMAAQIMPCIVPELQRPGKLRDLYHQMLEDRRDVTRSVLRRGIATGELRADTDIELATVMLSGPGILASVGFAPRLEGDDLPDRTVDLVLHGIATPRRS
jgi:AcrR family transcriptional regulator